jgi:protein SCO1/2
MRQSLIYILSIGLTLNLFAQTSDTKIEIGIVEKLGDTIPLHLEFYNEADDTISLAELVDKPTIFSFVYFDCPGLCSPLLAGVSDLIDKVGMELGTDYQVITISFNTKDTPGKATEKKVNFVQKISKDSREHWHYLTGEQENIVAITDAVGYKYKPQGVDFAHPSAIIMVSPKGKITRYLYGLSFLPFDAKMALIEAQKGIERPTINRILELCFAYDPGSRTYGLQIMKVLGILTLFILLIVFISLLFKGRKKTEKTD